MAFSGITLWGLTEEFNKKLLNGKIQKIAQPEALGLVFTIHTESGNHKLYISANASMPLIYLTKENKPSPLSAYNFLMVLRKYIGNARITNIKQFGLERVLRFELEHLDELKDVAKKYLYVEIMGKHSNIIFTDENNKIIDAIKHVGGSVSSVREVLPGREYFIPTQEGKMDIFETEKSVFYNKVLSRPLPIKKAISSSFIGFSKVTGEELALRAGLDGDLSLDTLHESEKQNLCLEFEKLKNDLITKNFSPTIILGERKPLEYSVFNLHIFPNEKRESFESVSSVIELFYAQKNSDNLIKQKSTDIKKLITNHIERANKKLELQKKQLLDTEKMEELRIYGELLQTYGYSLEAGIKEAVLDNYYDDNKPIKVPLNPDLSPIENSKKYFEKYDKLKRTKTALIPQLDHTKMEISHLSSILTSLMIAESNEDLSAIRRELFEYGYIKKRPENKKGNEKKSAPLHYVTKDGFDLYVGKNNYQNEEVTFKIARGNDWWFHAKNMPGSHVILKDKGVEFPDHVFELAANLAAYYSSAREGTHVEIDYVQRKELKKVPGAAKGFVIYYTNYSMTASPDISSLSIVP